MQTACTKDPKQARMIKRKESEREAKFDEDPELTNDKPCVILEINKNVMKDVDNELNRVLSIDH